MIWITYLISHKHPQEHVAVFFFSAEMSCLHVYRSRRDQDFLQAPCQRFCICICIASQNVKFSQGMESIEVDRIEIGLVF